MAINSTLFIISTLITFVVIINPTLSLNGFTTNLIHRETLNPSLNKYERLQNSIQRSLSKINQFTRKSSPNDVETIVKFVEGEYIMKLSFGTPPVSQFGIVDTGSDLIWIQCLPCLDCYKQTLPIFDPTKSSTFKLQSCDTAACRALDISHCSSRDICGYSYFYGDGSHTIGDLATDTITFNSLSNKTGGLSFPNLSIGCSHDSAGSFSRNGSGIVGLGNGPLSLATQLGSSNGVKFSYCLIPIEKEGSYTSIISFGTDAEVSGRGVVSTPIVLGEIETFYYLTLNSVSVRDAKIPFYKNISFNKDTPTTTKGNIIIDSGTTLTYLPSDMYSDLSSALTESIKHKVIDDPTGHLKVCYESKQGGSDLDIPDVTLHFDGADLVMKPSNTFVAVTKDVTCLAMAPSDGPAAGLAVLGNVAQMNFLVGYDTEQGKLSFKPTDCSEAAQL